MEFKVIIAGGRDFNDFDMLKSTVDKLLKYVDKSKNDIIIVSGKAKGADSLGEKYAKINNLKVESHPANWDVYGKSAGYRRNAEMAKSVSESQGMLIAFWDEKSRGTKNMIEISKRYNIETNVIKY